MIKVLYLLNYAGKAGTERYVYSLIEKLNNKKTKAFFAYNQKDLLVDRLKALDVMVNRINMRHPLDLKAAWDLNRLCKKLDIDIIHTQYLRENYIALISKIFNPKVKVIYTNHFILKNNFILRIFNRILTNLQSAIISVCNKGKDQMIENGINKNKISVIFNGVDPKLWSQEIDSTMRSEFNIDEDSFVMFCASHFAHDKGHHFLINSISELKKMTDKKFTLVLANDGPLFEEIKEYVKEKGVEDKVVFTGFRKDVKNLIGGSDLYINSSYHEALSFAILEMLAAGLPVIAADMGGNRDIINPESKNGILVKYNDERDLAQAILKVMSDEGLQRQMKENALKSINEKFNLDKMVRETYNQYKDSLK